MPWVDCGNADDFSNSRAMMNGCASLRLEKILASRDYGANRIFVRRRLSAKKGRHICCTGPFKISEAFRTVAPLYYGATLWATSMYRSG